jgi:hypothetical protein
MVMDGIFHVYHKNINFTCLINFNAETCACSLSVAKIEKVCNECGSETSVRTAIVWQASKRLSHANSLAYETYIPFK